MNWSVKAILARFDGNHDKAVMYCADMAATYPALRDEYTAYAKALNNTAMGVGA